jgi:hypothetical protein
MVRPTYGFETAVIDEVERTRGALSFGNQDYSCVTGDDRLGRLFHRGVADGRAAVRASGTE